MNSFGYTVEQMWTEIGFGLMLGGIFVFTFGCVVYAFSLVSKHGV